MHTHGRLLNKETGFLTANSPKFMPEYTELHRELNRMAKELPTLIQQKQVRLQISQLNKKWQGSHAILKLQNESEKNTAMRILTFLTQAYIFESPKKPTRIVPNVLACNLDILAKSANRPPILTYEDYALNNWHRIDETKSDLTLDNIEPYFTFTNTKDEKWFIKIHLAIEIICAPALNAIYEACILHYAMRYQNSFDPKDELKLLSLLNEIKPAFDEASKTLLKMKEQCRPDVFYHVFRPYLSGWDANLNIQFEGKLDLQQIHRGPSGAQSSILPAMDAALNIQHDQLPTEFLLYMPYRHQYVINLFQFFHIQLTEKASNKLTTTLKEAIDSVKRFRYMHYFAMVGRYINSPASKEGIFAKNVRGTGGTKIDEFLLNRHATTELSKAKL